MRCSSVMVARTRTAHSVVGVGVAAGLAVAVAVGVGGGGALTEAQERLAEFAVACPLLRRLSP